MSNTFRFVLLFLYVMICAVDYYECYTELQKTSIRWQGEGERAPDDARNVIVCLQYGIMLLVERIPHAQSFQVIMRLFSFPYLQLRHVQGLASNPPAGGMRSVPYVTDQRQLAVGIYPPHSHR